MYIAPLSLVNKQNYMRKNSTQLKKQPNIQQNPQQNIAQNFAPSFYGLQDLKQSINLTAISRNGKTIEGKTAQEFAKEKLDGYSPTKRTSLEVEYGHGSSGLHSMKNEDFRYFLDTIPEQFKQRLVEDNALSRLVSSSYDEQLSSRKPLLTIDEMKRYATLAPDAFAEEMASTTSSFMHSAYLGSLKHTEALFEIAPEVAKRTMLQKDSDGNTPVHTSILASKSDVWQGYSPSSSKGYNKGVFIDKLNVFAKYARDEFAQAITEKNNDGQNPLHILLNHSYSWKEEHGHCGFGGTDTSTTIKQALGLMGWVALSELKYALSDVDNNGDLPHFRRISSAALAEDLKTLIKIAPDETVNMLLQKPSDGKDLNIRNIYKEYEPAIIDTLKENAPQVFERLCFMDDENGKPILCRYVDERNIYMLEAMQECMGADRFFEAINRPYDDKSTIAEKIVKL